jgi:hypothetical protein
LAACTVAGEPAMSAGSVTACRTPANGAVTTSPAFSCGTHCSVLDMKAYGRTIVHARPPFFTLASASTMYVLIALPVSVLATELPDSWTTRSTPAARA